MIPIFDIKISKKSKDFANQCLKKNFISSQGNFVKDLEKEIAKFHKMKYCEI